jgi:hypothetical protein
MKMAEAVDNSMPAAKAELRRRNLPDNARVLDCFCGTGEMYRRAYEGRVDYYHGLDKAKTHSPELCTLVDNATWMARHDLGQFNVFDLDDYGCPWRLIYLILGRHPGETVTLFVTDGLATRMKRTGHVSKWVSATEHIRRDAVLPGILRWYPDIFATMLLDLERRYGWRVQRAEYFHNSLRTVYYWALKLSKTPA